MDKPVSSPERESSLWFHAGWREYIEKRGYKNIRLHKLYEKQLIEYATSTWSYMGDFEMSSSRHDHLTNINRTENMLNDDTQKTLIPFLEETRKLFDKAIEKHGHPDNIDGYSIIVPSLDLGVPNNTQRLAGGFATGLLVAWKCAIDIVPIDATVNVCTSSVFKIDRNRVHQEWFDGKKGNESFSLFVQQLSKKASKSRGYSFSFDSGNHFLLIAKDKKTEEYYLVMHSSANELKKSYMGLYPVENNWYSNKIKTVYNKDNTRYFRYLKDVEARYFIQMAHNFKGYNEQIHQWIAEEINGSRYLNHNDNQTRWMYHHYYMPTDNSIALGTFVEPIGTQVPMFSAHGKPIYIFQIGEKNNTINLGGEKGRVCLVPHGWGQKIEGLKAIRVENATSSDGRKLVLELTGTILLTRELNCQKNKLENLKMASNLLASGKR